MPHFFSNPLTWLISLFILIVAISSVYALLQFFRSRSPAVRLAKQQQKAIRLNEGWRIALIPTGDFNQAPPSSMLLVLLSGPIIILFLVGFELEINDEAGSSYLPGIFMVGSMAALGILIYLRGRGLKRQRARWVVVPARCADLEIRQVSGNDFNDGANWLCRLVCEFDHNGQHYRITPVAHRRFSRADECGFPSQGEAQAFLSSKVATDGTCSVRINPNDPLQGELC
jgi:hypothetical protein